MAKKNSVSFYAVHKGRTPGVYMTWEECKAQIDGFSSAKYQKFPLREQAEKFVASGNSTSTVTVTANSNVNLGTTREITPPSTTSKHISTVSAGGTTSDTVKGKKRTLDDLVDDLVDFPSPSKASTTRKKERPDINVYCDGACKGNGKPGSIAGIGVWWAHDDERNIFERCPGDQTNNRAELYAIARVLETTDFTKNKLIIWTDSKYSINCFNDWQYTWRANGWRNSKGDPVKNAALIRYVATLLDYRLRIGQPVRLEYVRGHAGIEGNEGADALANQGTLLPEREEKDWARLEAEYKRTYEDDVKKVEEERRKRAQSVDTLEIAGAEEARADLEKEMENSPARKVRKIGEEKGCEVKDCKPACVAAVSAEPLKRRYSAGLEKPSAEDLEAFANLAEDDEFDSTGTPPATQASGSPSGSTSESKSFSVSANHVFTQEELLAYAEGLDDDLELSD